MSETSVSETAALSLEKIMDELEHIVGSLEGGERSLDESLQLFERGVKLARVGQERIDTAEKRVEQLLNGNTPNETKAPF